MPAICSPQLAKCRALGCAPHNGSGNFRPTVCHAIWETPSRRAFSVASGCSVASITGSHMTFDFDTVLERRGTDSQKWQKYAGRDVLPLWVADMDFKSSPAIIGALQERVAQGVFGYARPVKSTVDAFVNALEQRYGWRVDPSWLV